MSSAGLSEAEYNHLAYDLPVAAAQILASVNPQMTFVYVSGEGTDSSEDGSNIWARIKGKTENALMHMPFKAAYMFRPGVIQPLQGIKSKTQIYRIIYAAIKPILPFLRFLFPSSILTTEQIGKATIAVAKNGTSKKVLRSSDSYELVKL